MFSTDLKLISNGLEKVTKNGQRQLLLDRVSDPYSLIPDPAENLNPDPDPSYFLTLSEKQI